MLGIVSYSDSDTEDGGECIEGEKEEHDTHSPDAAQENGCNKDAVITKVKCGEVKSDNSDESEGETEAPTSTLLPLPAAFTPQNGVSKRRKRKTNGDQHSGRKRTFEHMEGNWATYMFFPVQETEQFQREYDKVIKSLRRYFADDIHVFPVDSCHISVSRTVPVRHYWIEPMFEKLKTSMEGVPAFRYSFTSLKVYTNDEKTRTFVGFEISHGCEHFTDVVKKTDQIYRDFDLELYYVDPSFHASVAWLLGDRKSDVEKCLEKCGLGKLGNQLMYQCVDRLCMKSGNKILVVPLQ